MNDVAKQESIKDRIIDLLFRVGNRLLFPKFANKLTWTVVLAGLTQFVTASFIQALSVDLLEREFGEFPLLRDIVINGFDPVFGIRLIAFGLLYHVASQVVAVLPKWKSTTSNPPILIPQMLSYEGNVFPEEHQIEGKRVLVNNKDDIDDYQETVNHFDPFASSIYRTNSDYYRDKATLLEDWCGAILFKLVIKNDSEYVGSSVVVELHFESEGDVDFSLVFAPPSFPQKKDYSIQNLANVIAESKGNSINILSKLNTEIIQWNIGNIQPSFTCESVKMIRLKCDADTHCVIRIFSDELPRPVESKIKLNCDSLIEVSHTITRSSEEEFKELVLDNASFLSF